MIFLFGSCLERKCSGIVMGWAARVGWCFSWSVCFMMLQWKLCIALNFPIFALRNFSKVVVNDFVSARFKCADCWMSCSISEQKCSKCCLVSYPVFTLSLSFLSSLWIVPLVV